MTNKQPKTTSNPNKVKNSKEDKKLLIAVDEKNKAIDSIVDEWLIEHFRNKLKKATAVVNRLNKPLALYSNILEESEGDAAKEEIVLHNQKYITVQIFTRGGFIPTSFQEQYVFTIDKFISWIIQERKNGSRKMILQCLETLQNGEK
ncbi:MAG TPA: hypothetical protein VJ225_02120 [Nitrososphaeraceae archaeon]|nr:hypothetical protein [Nitrososphaeraceae archaeon]